MSGVLTPGLISSAATQVTRLRELPLRGKVLVKVGESVTAQQVVARAERPGDLMIVRAPEILGIEPFEVHKGLKVKDGDLVQQGQIICEHKGLFGLFTSRLESPYAGVVEILAERTGHIGVRLAPKLIEVQAYIAGLVIAVQEGSSVTIQTQAGMVQGIFGVGGERTGRLQVLELPNESKITEAEIPLDCRGQVLVGGTMPSAEALLLAASRGAVGFVTGSIDDRALAGYLGYDLGIALTGDEAISMSVIITEGFGLMPISERIMKLFRGWQGRAVSINGATQVRAGALRPEVIVPSEGAHVNQGQSASAHAGLEVGARIRVIRVPYFGASGEVIELPHAAQTIETGAVTRVLKAKLDDGRTVTVPRANVELQ